MQKSNIQSIINRVRQDDRTKLTEAEAKEVLTNAGMTTTREELVSSESEAIASAKRIGFPVALKIASPDILHKTDVGGVLLDINDVEEVRQGYRAIMGGITERYPKAIIHGVLIQEMMGGGIETIVGISNKPPFGPVVAYGLGGVFVDVLKDVTFRLAPIDEMGATEMLAEIRGAEVLDGYRGQPKANKVKLAKALTQLSELAIEFHRDIEELDINPLVVKGDDVIALDALITLTTDEFRSSLPPSENSGKQHENDIRAVLEPRSIAVIGASTNPEKTGHVLLKNILVNGFQGRVYPINPHADEILGLKVYPSILEVPDDIDLVFFLLPGKFVATLLEDCAKKGVKAAVIISAGFAEVGDEGEKRQKVLEDLIKQTGVRCLGPNSIGFINMGKKLAGSFILFENWEEGQIGLAGQSGIFAGAVADQLMFRTVQRIGIGASVIFGNKIDLDETDFLEWAWKEPGIQIAALYLEGMKEPRRFFSLANKVKRDMPIIVLKTGRTEAGAKASASHTGSFALDDTLIDHTFRQYGVTRAKDLEEFLEFMKAFSYQPLPRGNRVGIVTFSGANGVLASDELSERGFELAEFEPVTHERVKKFLPEWQPVANPLDLWASLGAGNRLVHEEGLLSVLNDNNVDAVLLILLGLANADFDGMREVFTKALKLKHEKPLYTVVLGGEVKQKWLLEIDGLNVPVFETTLIAAKALTAAWRYAQVRELRQPEPFLH